MEIESFVEVAFVVIILIGSIVSTARKARRQRIAKAARHSSSPVKAKPAANQPHPYAPAQPTVMPPMSFSDVPGQVIAPTVHPHVQPDCATHDAPGSLGVTSLEGKDPCHAEQLKAVRTVQAPAPEQPALTFDWSGENMVKAFVMQEVLTRPCQRQAR